MTTDNKHRISCLFMFLGGIGLVVSVGLHAYSGWIGFTSPSKFHDPRIWWWRGSVIPALLGWLVAHIGVWISRWPAR